MLKVILTIIFIKTICATPFDDGKYRPQKVHSNNDGRYYRPLNEGKYIPGDEGRYTYIYRQGIYPADEGDYRYNHQEGPGDPGNYRYIHQDGPKGPDGKPGKDYFEPSFPNKYYLNNKIYAEKYKHFKLNNWVQAIVDKYVPFYNIYNAEQTENYFRSVSPENFRDNNFLNCTKLWDEYVPSESDKEKLLSLYNIEGERSITSFAKKFKLLYQVFVKIYED